MKKKRIIPVLLLRDNWLVQSRKFSEYKKIGDPIMGVKRFSDWDADELIYLDIEPNKKNSMSRTDTGNSRFLSGLEALAQVSLVANMPITIGGGIETLQDIEDRLVRGADKVSLNTTAIRNPSFISDAAREFGSQCIVISIDYKLIEGKSFVWNRCLPGFTGQDLFEWANEVENLGAGELLLTNIDRDGMKNGYDLETIETIAATSKIPIIACGGAGSWSDMTEVFEKTKADAVAAANLFHFQDQSIYLARKELFNSGLQVRPPSLSS